MSPDLSSISSETWIYTGFVIVLSLLLTAASVYVRRTKKKAVADPATESITPDSVAESTPTTQDTAPHDPQKNVWKERQSKGIHQPSIPRKSDVGNKPFGSSYYYAHNSTKAKGGYSDGLQMEDYTMNQPRLLSRGGKSFVEKENGGREEIAEATEAAPIEKAPTRSIEPSTSVPKKRTIPITRYLWDDPGDSKGIGTIRIDSLPDVDNTTTMAWQEATILDIAAVLSDTGGLIVTLQTQEVDYELRIRTLYGKVVKVETKSTSKRLLIKLCKEKGKGNSYRAWPQPHKSQ